MSRNECSRQATHQTHLITKYSDLSPYPTRWWWHNPSNADSLRLHNLSYDVLAHSMQHKFFKFKLTHDILPKTLVQLERHFNNPYYIQNYKTIYLMGEQEAMMLVLHANNLQQYLDNHKE